MQGMRSLTLGLVAALTAASVAESSALACMASRGKHVELTAQSLDPDVFVWDSMARLINYQSGNYITADVLHHTLLAPAGTRAVVIVCRDRVVHPRFVTGAADAVGIRLVSGRNRGQYGWVVSDDLHMPIGILPVQPAH